MVGENDEAIKELYKKSKLPGKVIILGDTHNLKHFNSICSYWPLQEWKNKNKGFYSIIGYPNKKYKTNPKKKVINICTDQCNFKPQDLNSMIGLISEINI